MQRSLLPAVFYWPGHDTTASAISWSLHALALHPHVQDHLRAEVEETLGDREIE